MMEDVLLQSLKKYGAYWSSRDFSDTYHVELTNGKHSGQYLNLSKLNRIQLMKAILLDSAIYETLQDLKFDCVCGQAYGSISWALLLSEIYNVDFIYTEKGNGPSIKRFDFEKYKSILVCEDVLTTGGTSLKTAMCIGLENVNSIFTVVNRSKLSDLSIGNSTFKIYSCADINTIEYEASDCPFCKKGSQAIRPKGCWDLLIDQYNPKSMNL